MGHRKLTTIGDHLRKALAEVASRAAGLAATDERIAEALKPLRRSATQRADAAVLALLDYTEAVADLANGIHHALDEVRAGRAPADDETVRRAALLTAVCCHEIDQLTVRASTS